MDVSIETRTADRNVVVLDVAGRLAAGETGMLFRGIFQRSLGEGRQKFLVNLEKVSYIDSSGLGELITSHTSLRNRGGAVKLLKPSKRIRDLLQMTKLLHIFEIFDDEAAAVESFPA
ncbi:MAG TPA: STAS domain-containing protein [Terriglobia bacterium]|nr:STAS domain-containing protein [Terriglobia bacterium]